MNPLCAESSTVSLPPRERILCKRRAKAIRRGQPVPPHSTTGTKHSAKAPAPTLAATRKRRLAALNVAYLDRPDGYHIKRVVRCSPTPQHTPPIPYLPGQDDIPGSDTEYDEESDDGTVATVPEIGLPISDPDIDMGTRNETLPTQLDGDEAMDYDAEGETDNEMTEDYPGPSLSLANFSPLGAAWELTQPDSTPRMWPEAPAPAHNLIVGASEDELRALFDGLDRFPADFPTDLPADFSANLPNGSLANAGGELPAATGTWGLDTNVQELGSFGMHQLHAAVHDLQMPELRDQHSHTGFGLLGMQIDNHSAQLHAPVRCSPPFTLSRAPTPASAMVPLLGLSSLSAHHSPLSRPASRPTPVSRTGTPTPHSNTRALVAKARAKARSLAEARACALSPPAFIPQPRSPPPPIATPQPCSLDNVRAQSLILRRLPPLRRSLDLPAFLQGDGDESDEDRSRPPTPVQLEDTDIGMNEHSPRPVTQARARAIRYANVRVLPRHSNPNNLHPPTTLDLEINALRIFKATRRRNRSRRSTTTEPARNRKILSSASLSHEQQLVVTQMEYHITKNLFCDTPWPDFDQRDEFLVDAQQYATAKTGVSGDEVFSPIFLDTVYYRAPGNRGSSLGKMEYMMETEFDIASIQKPEIFELMDKDQFLYPNKDQNPNEYFCVGALGSALEILLFKSSKLIGVVFMDELCKPDDPEKCANWHRKLRDRSARRGVPPGLLAFAATQMYWALEKLYMGSTVHFDEQHYRGVWNRYFHALLKLPHLGRLRMDMLNRMKEYYMIHWPAAEPNEDEVLFPAW